MTTFLLSVGVGLIALQHLAFAVLESVLWQKPLGRKVFGLSEADAASTAPLAFNQGVYNVFLAAGLIWSLVHPDPGMAASLQVFFLGCVVIAGVAGGVSVRWTICLVQGLPAALTLGLRVLV